MLDLESSNERNIMYAAGGDMPEILQTLLGVEVISDCVELFVQDIDLVVQTLGDVNDETLTGDKDLPSAQAVLSSKHPETWKGVAFKRARGVFAPALGFLVTKRELEIIDDLVLTELGWQERDEFLAKVPHRQGNKRSIAGLESFVTTHVLTGEQTGVHYQHHYRFIHSLVSPSSLPVAAMIRELHRTIAPE